MLEFFKMQNWPNVFNEDGFGTLAFLLCITAVLLPAFLFSDRMQLWRSARQHKPRWQPFQQN